MPPDSGGDYLCDFVEMIYKIDKDSPNRLDKAREGFRTLGVEIKEFWFCQGRYDMVAMIEAPDIQTYAKALLKLGSYGNIHAETLRALPENEYREIIAAIP